VDADRVPCQAEAVRFPRSCLVQVEGADVQIANRMEKWQVWEAGVEAARECPKVCIFVPLEVELVLRRLVGSRSTFLVLFCEAQLGNGKRTLTEMLDAALVNTHR
jgi:hypothetical protein